MWNLLDIKGLIHFLIHFDGELHGVDQCIGSIIIQPSAKILCQSKCRPIMEMHFIESKLGGCKEDCCLEQPTSSWSNSLDMPSNSLSYQEKSNIDVRTK